MLNSPKYVIIHHSAGPDDDHLQLERIRWYHVNRRRWRDIGYHRIYEKVRGQYVALAGRPLHMSGSHALQYNARSIGCCFVGNFTYKPPPDAQLQAGARDVAGLMTTLSIPEWNLLKHKEVSVTECPGDKFPWKRFRAMVGYFIRHPDPYDPDLGLFA